MLNVDVEPLNPRLLNNKLAHFDYLKHTQEEATILREIIKQGKSQNPLNAYLDYACKYTKQIQELLIIIEQTCPSFNSREKLAAVTPKNKEKKVRFTEPVTSSGNTNTKIASSSNLVSNKPALSSKGVKPSTSASGSQPSGNTKKDKIQRTPHSTQKNKVEAHPGTIKSSLKNKNCAVEPKRTASVQHSNLNVNSELKCVTTLKFVDEIGELRVISGHILGAAGVQIPENNLDNLHSSREEDEILETVDPQDLLGSFLLAGLGVSVFTTIDFLEGTTLVVVILVKGHSFPNIVKEEAAILREIVKQGKSQNPLNAYLDYA
nr:hypothetical protein [Tanacetum cinerariifolium]